MNDEEFMTDIITQICDYAVANNMELDETVRDVAENLILFCEIATFEEWRKK